MSDTYVTGYTLYLKNSTAAEIAVDDLGIIVSPGSSITFDENDIDGYLTPGMITALGTNAANGLVLSTTDIGDSTGDLTKTTAVERLTLNNNWKPARANFAAFPLDGNVDGDLRLALDTNAVWRWNQASVAWVQTTNTYTLTVGEYDGDPLGSGVDKLIFVQAEDSVFIDATNPSNKVAYIGPPSLPTGLNAANLTISGTTLYSGGLSDGNYNYNSTAGQIMGSIVSYIINDGVFTLTTPTTSTGCNYGDRGVLQVWLNSTMVADIDLSANFNEANRTGSQSISSYNTKGVAVNTPVAGVVSFSDSLTGKGSLTIASVQIYNGFKFYQKFIANINITDATCLRQGWNEIYMVHTLVADYGGNQTSNKMNFFYDIDTRDAGANPAIASPPTVSEDVPAFTYLSGIKYYGLASTWKVSFTANYGFNNVYHSSNAPVVISNWPGMTSTSITWSDPTVSEGFAVNAPNHVPSIGDTMSVVNWVVSQGVDRMTTNAQITVTPRDPYASYTPVSSASQNIMIYSYGQYSTNLVEHFRDETYRLPNGSYDTIPGSFTGLWDSTKHIGTWTTDATGLQLFMDELYFPTVNFSTGYLPMGNPDYSTLANLSDRTYLRAMKHNNSLTCTTGCLRLTGIDKTMLYSGQLKIFIKAPSQTGWLDLSKDYNYGTYQAIDGDGCWVNRDIQTDSDFNFTIGNRYTQLSGRMIIVKIIYPNKNSPRVSYMSVTNWTI